MSRASRSPLAPTLVVGPGRVGRTLAYAQARYGARVWLLGRSRGAWQSWARRQGIVPLLALDGAAATAGTLLLCVPDAELTALATQLAPRLAPMRRRLVAHMSGIHGLAPLQAFARRGAAVAALHPLLPFADPNRSLLALQGALVTVQAGPRARAAALSLVRRWGARPRRLPARINRHRYHLGLALAANHLTGLLAWSEDLLRPALGAQARAAACALAAAALEQVRASGPARALTGPVVRGDLGTVAAHLAALAPAERARYRALIATVLELAERSGRLPHAKAAALARLR